ncbi:uncharacterized protein DSM5745_06817 [Aspergillus mulundensis]|uniref:Uncharacterized protein n=1 Tax=Aspergillus mulundensis TaxID=1810919 RepID=A0A3D8RS38_9EURO|nr:hypothetical protein DSM5745_06817 [Aspergillus mulundensis]RDW76825.1 hypothetical protein DSM5745_06817 [Aspergillus mulundensis]
MQTTAYPTQLTHGHQLFHGTLKLLQAQKVKISTKDLAAYMGPAYTPKSIDHQLAKLRKEAQATAPSASALALTATQTQQPKSSLTAKPEKNTSSPTGVPRTTKKRGRSSVGGDAGPDAPAPVKKAKGRTAGICTDEADSDADFGPESDE